MAPKLYQSHKAASTRPLSNGYPKCLACSHWWWSSTVGQAIRTLLEHAKYSLRAQDHSMNFFESVIVPELGVACLPDMDTASWASFMTDDGRPIELSWEWPGKDEPPRVRFCMEPVGWEAGTAADPDNRFAPDRCAQTIHKACPGFDTVWFNHLTQRLLKFDGEPEGWKPAHSSRMFLGFDLGDNEIRSKAYFSSKFEAAATGQSDVQVMADVISSLPDICPTSFVAFQSLARFLTESRQSRPLDLEGIAIDCVDPTRSRIKLYVRCTEASFDSVQDIVLMGGALCHPFLIAGLQRLRNLWDCLFGRDTNTLVPRPCIDVKTAGIIYNFELRRGMPIPIPKVYIPVRHYCPSDEHILSALQDYFYQYRDDDGGMQGYMNAMATTL